MGNLKYNKIHALVSAKVVLFAAFVTVLVSCNKTAEDEFIISGKADGIKDGTDVFLQKQDSTGMVYVDTVKVTEGKFQFEGKVNEPNIHFIVVKDIQGGFPFVLENGEIEMTVNKDTIGKSKVAGTYSNDQLAIYSKEYEKISKQMQKYQETNMEKWTEAAAKKDTVTRNALIKGNKVYEDQFKKLMEDQIANHPKSYLSLLFVSQLVNQPDQDATTLKKKFDSLDEKLKNTKEGKKIKKNLESLSAVAIGSKAPDFSAPDVNGKNVSLKESLGKVTLIDFWASWCAPCRQENPNVVALYSEFHKKGLNIIGVSLDKAGDDAKWKEAIAKDGLVWTQISNLKYWDDPIAKQYNIKGIPATFLLDANGKIVAKDLRGDELKAKVASLLGS